MASCLYLRLMGKIAWFSTHASFMHIKFADTNLLKKICLWWKLQHHNKHQRGASDHHDWQYCVIRYGDDIELPVQRACHHQLPFWEGTTFATLQRRTRAAQVTNERIVYGINCYSDLSLLFCYFSNVISILNSFFPDLFLFVSKRCWLCLIFVSMMLHQVPLRRGALYCLQALWGHLPCPGTNTVHQICTQTIVDILEHKCITWQLTFVIVRSDSVDVSFCPTMFSSRLSP